MGSFIIEESKTIYYKVVDNYSEKTRVVNGVERIGRYIYFYNDKDEFIKSERIYGDYDEMQNISPIYAKEIYEKKWAYNALNLGVILVQIWCNTLSNDTHDVHDIARKHTINARYHTIFYDIHDIKQCS